MNQILQGVLGVSQLFSTKVNPIIIEKYFKTLPIIEVNSGVDFCDAVYSDLHNYIHGVPIPNDKWVSCNPDEYVGSESEFISKQYSSVGFISLPPILVEEVRRLNKLTDYLADYSDISKSVARYLVPHFEIHPSTFVNHDLIKHNAGVRSTTVDQKTQKRPGLHIDSWSSEEDENRLTSKIRFNVNLGPGKRSFLFASRGINVQGEWDGNLDPSAYYNFLRSSPSTPIYRVTLEPGMGYVAATECLIHDGSTATEEFLPAISYQLRGKPNLYLSS
jgi:hypothetical protein